MTENQKHDEALELIDIEKKVELIWRFIGNPDEMSQDGNIHFTRCLLYKNILLGDLNMFKLIPSDFDPSGQTYIKIFKDGLLSSIKDFLLSKKFVEIKNVFIHCGSVKLNRFQMTPTKIAQAMIGIIAIVRVLAPEAKIHVSQQFPFIFQEESFKRTKELNTLLENNCSMHEITEFVPHPELYSRIRNYLRYGETLRVGHPLHLFSANIQNAIRVYRFEKDTPIGNLSTECYVPNGNPASFGKSSKTNKKHFGKIEY